MNLEKALATPGWTTEQELSWLAKHAAKSNCIAEIGSWRGRSTRAMVDNSDAKIFCIDPWVDDSIGYPGWWTAQESPEKYKQKDWLWSEFNHNLHGCVGTRIVPVRMFSAYAFQNLYPRGLKFDMIFIDGSHDYGHVVGDIQMFRQMLKPGGVLCGHDYNEPTCPEVAPAVNSQFSKIDVTGTIWCAF